MTALAWITGVILIVGFAMAGGTKLMGVAMATEMADRLGYTRLLRLIGVAEVVGAIGVLIGLVSADLEWLGVLAALGLIATMVGAVVYHQRGGDGPKDSAPAVVLAVLAVLYIIALFGN